MNKTYKIKHNQNLTEQLIKAQKVAQYAINNPGSFSSKDVSHIGLKSAITNQILRKYGKNKKLKKINPNRVKLALPGQSIKYDNIENTISLTPLKIKLDSTYLPEFEKVCHIELDKEYAHIIVKTKEENQFIPKGCVGIDLNATGHLAVCATSDGSVMKLGKKASHTSKKYKAIRKNLQKQGKYKVVKKIKDRESRIQRDLNHKISSKIVLDAKNSQSAIVLEKLTGIKKNTRREVKKLSRKNRGVISSWSFYQLQKFIEYKAKKYGVPVVYINPYNTSRVCARCGGMGNRVGKIFECPSCGHVEHADVNAAFNIRAAGDVLFNLRQNVMSERGVLVHPKRHR